MKIYLLQKFTAVSENEKQRIFSIADSIPLDSYQTRTTIEDSCWHDPRLYETISITENRKVYHFKLDAGCRSYIIKDKILAGQLNRLFALIKQLMNLRRAIREAPQSDIGYF